MNCDDIRATILDLDNHEALPEVVAEHLSDCDACRSFSEQMADAANLVRLPVALTANPELTARIMAAVRLEAESRLSRFLGNGVAPPFAIRGWLIVGTVILASLFLVPFSDILNTLRRSLGPGIDLALSLALGIGLTVYICVLVVSNHTKVEGWLSAARRPRR